MNSLDTPVEQVMTKPVKTVDRELAVRDVSKLLASEAVGSVKKKYSRKRTLSPASAMGWTQIRRQLVI